MARLAAILDSHFQFTLIAWVKEPVTVQRVASELRFAIAHAFGLRNIQFPTPELELHTPSHDGQQRPEPFDGHPTTE